MDRLLREGKTTGTDQSNSKVGFISLNRRRMDRLSRTIELVRPVKDAARRFDRKMIWLVITEGWCGDAARNIPIVEKIAMKRVNIETRYILRDENPELMDQFLTDGARSVPRLIALDAATCKVLGTWGSRPVAAQQLFRELQRRGVAKALIMENIQCWYSQDKGRSLQAEFTGLLNEWSKGVRKVQRSARIDRSV